MKFNVRKLSTSITVSLLTFLLGVVSSAFVSHQRESRKLREMSTIEDRIEQWHRLYEAAGMTGDDEIRVWVFNRLICTNSAGQSGGVMVYADGSDWCRLEDGTLTELNSFMDHGSFSQHIFKSHLDWSIHHLDFVESVGSAEKARRYVSQHRWPQ